MTSPYFVASLGEQRYGLPLDQVDEIVRAAQLIRLPQAPKALLGALILRGEPLPVIDLRPRLGMPSRPLEPSDLFLIGRVGPRRGIVVATAVEGIVPLDPAAGSLEALPVPDYSVAAVADPGGRPVLLLDLARVLSAPEASEIQAAMETFARQGEHADR
ncbi:MAG: chemotaxis protein CheW [Deltaproteobacteria bacterium]